MKWVVIGVLLVVALVLFRALGSPARSGMSEASLDDLPEMVSLLASSHVEGSFFALGADSAPGLNVQFSFEGGVVGFDWVLLAPTNLADRQKAESFAASRGQPLEERSLNNVAYLRTTTGDVAALCRAVLHEMWTAGGSPLQRERAIAKFWLSPVALASSTGFPGHELRRLEALVEHHRTEFQEAWHEFFGPQH